MYDMAVFNELDKFNDILYHDEPHKYYFEGSDIPLVSVTQITGKYQTFDQVAIATKQSNKTGQSVDEILLDWESAGIKGTCVHEYIEDLLSRKIFPYPVEMVYQKLGKMLGDRVTNAFNTITPIVDKFCRDIRGKLIPIKSELVMGDRELWISGMADQIFYNKKSGMLEIWDWKTNKKIDTYSNFKLEGSLSYLDSSKLTVYSLQLSLYKFILEKNTNLKFGDNYICWFNENNTSYVVHKCHDMSKEVAIMINELNK